MSFLAVASSLMLVRAFSAAEAAALSDISRANIFCAAPSAHSRRTGVAHALQNKHMSPIVKFVSMGAHTHMSFGDASGFSHRPGEDAIRRAAR